jgi:hypothetical protein
MRVVIAGGGPTGLMLAGELALAGVDVAIVERRGSPELIGSRAGGLHSRTIEMLDQRGIADRFLSQGQVAQVVRFNMVPLDISDFPTRHNYGLGLSQNHIERILAEWVGELAVTIHRGREVTDFAQDDTGVDVAHSCGRTTLDRVYCWGFNNSGQLGDGTSTTRLRPVAVKGGIPMVQIWAGYMDTCGVTATGVAYCWGGGQYGQIGDGSADIQPRLVPVRVVGPE